MMKWSQLKVRIESMFADSVAGRVEVWNTRYRKTHEWENEEQGEAWITIDKRRIYDMGDATYRNQLYYEGLRLQSETDCLDYTDPNQIEGYNKAWDEAQQIGHDRGIFSREYFNKSLFNFLNLSIDVAIKSDNPIIRALSILDRRFGKRRLIEFDDSTENPLVKTLYRFRCEAEGIDKASDG
jgi:hypothetical protein